MHLAQNKKVPTSAELKNLPIARKSLVASKDIKEGEELSEFNIAIKRPGTGLSPYKYWELLGKKASKAINLETIFLSSSKFPLIIIGGGGHASVLADILLLQGRKILAVIAPNSIENHPQLNNFKHLKKDKDILQFDKNKCRLINGIGMMPGSQLKFNVNEFFLGLGYKFETLISDKVYVSPYSKIKSGSQIMPGAVIQTGAVIESHTIINTGALIEHGCSIGSYNHIAPGSTICGEVKTEANVFVGSGATVIQNLSIGSGAIVGAGVCIKKSIKTNTTVTSNNF